MPILLNIDMTYQLVLDRLAHMSWRAKVLSALMLVLLAGFIAGALPAGAQALPPPLPLDRSLITCEAIYQLRSEAIGTDYRLGQGDYEECIRTFEESIGQAWHPQGVEPDGYLSAQEAAHAAYLNGVCFGEARPDVHWRLFGAMDGEIACPTGANITTLKVHIEAPASQPVEVNKRVITNIFGAIGRAGEALGVSFCESRWQNVNGWFYAGLFQLDPNYAAPGNILWQWGLSLTDRDDPGYNAAAARAKVLYLGGWGTGEWPNCRP